MPETPTVKKSLQAKDYAALGTFRHAMRKLLRFSKELVATRAKLTTEQYDALLAIKGSSGANGVTVGEISEQLQVKHHTAVSLLDRLEARKLATRKRAHRGQTQRQRAINEGWRFSPRAFGRDSSPRTPAARSRNNRCPAAITGIKQTQHATRASPSIEPAPSMLPSEIKDWPDWNNTTRFAVDSWFVCHGFRQGFQRHSQPTGVKLKR